MAIIGITFGLYFVKRFNVNDETILRTLLAINDKLVLLIPKAFLLPTAGFGRLRSAGYLVVTKLPLEIINNGLPAFLLLTR